VDEVCCAFGRFAPAPVAESSARADPGVARVLHEGEPRGEFERHPDLRGARAQRLREACDLPGAHPAVLEARQRCPVHRLQDGHCHGEGVRDRPRCRGADLIRRDRAGRHLGGGRMERHPGGGRQEREDHLGGDLEPPRGQAAAVRVPGEPGVARPGQSRLLGPVPGGVVRGGGVGEVVFVLVLLGAQGPVTPRVLESAGGLAGQPEEHLSVLGRRPTEQPAHPARVRERGLDHPHQVGLASGHRFAPGANDALEAVGRDGSDHRADGSAEPPRDREQLQNPGVDEQPGGGSQWAFALRGAFGRGALGGRRRPDEAGLNEGPHAPGHLGEVLLCGRRPGIEQLCGAVDGRAGAACDERLENLGDRRREVREDRGDRAHVREALGQVVEVPDRSAVEHVVADRDDGFDGLAGERAEPRAEVGGGGHGAYPPAPRRRRDRLSTGPALKTLRRPECARPQRGAHRRRRARTPRPTRGPAAA